MWLPPVFLVSGISGSGKTTYIKKHLPNTLVCSADHYFEQGGIYRFDPTKLGEAHGACLRKFTGAVSDPLGMRSAIDAIVVDNTFTTALELAPYVALANAYGVTPEIITLHTEAGIAYKRNRHDVPLRTIQRMFDTLEKRQVPAFWNVRHNDLYLDGE